MSYFCVRMVFKISRHIKYWLYHSFCPTHHVCIVIRGVLHGPQNSYLIKKTGTGNIDKLRQNRFKLKRTQNMLCAASSGHLLCLEFGFWFRFRFWIVCSKEASSGINVTQGNITRNDSKFIQIHRAYIHFGMGRTEEHLHVDTTHHLGKQTWRRSRTTTSQMAIQGAGTRPYMETLPSPPPRQPIQRSKDTRPHVDM